MLVIAIAVHAVGSGPLRTITGWVELDDVGASNPSWKREERYAAALIGGRRYWANAGMTVDAESPTFVAQVKHVARCSLAELEALALDAERIGSQKAKIGIVVIKRKRARTRLVVLTEPMWREMSGRLPG